MLFETSSSFPKEIIKLTEEKLDNLEIPEDDFIRKNPFDFELASVLVNDSVIRQALTRRQERLNVEDGRSGK